MNQKLSALTLYVVIALVSFGNSQIYIDGHYEKCCHVQYVFSIDISASIPHPKWNVIS